MSASSCSTRLSMVLAAIGLVAGSAVTAAQPVIDGRWIGGFNGASGVVAVDVAFGRVGGTLVGSIDVPRRAEYGIPLGTVEQKGDRVTFQLPTAGLPMHFEGRVRDRRMRGTVRQGPGGFTTFELTKLVTLSDSELARVHGTFVRDDGKVLLVAPSLNGAIYVDYDSGRTGALYALSPRHFVGGPTMGTGYPVAIEIVFDGDDGARAERARITRGKKTVEARRHVFYTEEDVRFTSTTADIAGSLLLPATPGPHPALVMIHGSGGATRDVLRPFADHFARNGVAVLITDKRGVGASTGDAARATFDDLADDALAGVAYLRGRGDIRADAIGLHGISLGGWVAPLAATRSRDVAFVVVESAPALTPREHERLRVESQLRADGFGHEDIARALAFMDLKFEVARTGEGWERLQRQMQNDAAWLPYTNPPTSLESLRWHWDHIFGYDPVPALTRLEVPMLVLYGGRDAVVPPRVHRRRMEEALAAAGRHDVTIKVFDEANHGFFEAVTGGRREHASLTGFVDGYFEQRTAWVLSTVRDASSLALAETQE